MSLLHKLLGRFVRRSQSHDLPIRNPQCTEFEVDTWELSAFVVEELVPVVGIRPFPLHELMLLSGAVCRFRPSHIFEWGTHIGKSARVFYETAVYYRLGCQIHSIDLPDDVGHVEHPANLRGQMVRGLPSVHLHQGDGVQVALDIWKGAGRPARVLFLIDGDHAEQSVYRELTTILDIVPMPVVLLHDTFYQSSQAAYNVGPHSAINRALREREGKFRRIDSGLGLPGMTLLYVSDS